MSGGQGGSLYQGPLRHGYMAHPLDHVSYRRCTRLNGVACDLCKQAHSTATLNGNARRAAMLRADPSLREHGKPSTYLNWECRCEECKACMRPGERRRRTARREPAKPSAPGTYQREPADRRHYKIEPFGREWLNADDDSTDGDAAETR